MRRPAMAHVMHEGGIRERASSPVQKGSFQMADRQANHLGVTGTGKVQVAPDEAIVHLSIVTEASTAAEAVASNGRQAQTVIDAVSAEPNHGVTTSGLSVYPIMSYEPDTSVSKIVGFRAQNGVDVTTKPGYVGQIFDAGMAAGANQSSGITFRVQNESPYREEALRLAVEEAIKEAKIVARAANLTLHGIESMQVEPGDGVIFFRSEAVDAKAMATPVLPERQTITARVSVQFRTRDHLEVPQGKIEPAKQQSSARPPGRA
jgi:uncharacterized protein